MTGGAKRKNAALKLDLSDEQKTDIKEAFNLFDSQGSGVIDTKDLKVRCAIEIGEINVLHYFCSSFFVAGGDARFGF